MLKMNRLIFMNQNFARLFSNLSSSSSNINHEKINNMVGKHFLTLQDYDSNQIEELLWSALDMKQITTINNTNLSAKKYYLNHVLTGSRRCFGYFSENNCGF